MLKVYFFHLPKLKKKVVWGAGPKWRSGSCVPGDKKAQNRSSVALHALSYSMSQTLQNVIKKKTKNKEGMLVTEILNTCTRWSNKHLLENFMQE